MPKLATPSNLRDGLQKTPISEMVEIKAGWFGRLEKNEYGRWEPIITWTHCRDVFQDAPNHEIFGKGMWFCHGSAKAENICEFVERIESKLELDEKTYFKKTKFTHIVWLQPSTFWVNNFVRRSFFTLVLRCGMRYKRMKDNFNAAMYNHYKIAKETTPAIKRFLNGYTWYTKDEPASNSNGWHYLFTDFNSKPIEGKYLEGLLIKT